MILAIACWLAFLATGLFFNISSYARKGDGVSAGIAAIFFSICVLSSIYLFLHR